MFTPTDRQALNRHLANHFQATDVRESGMLVGVHPVLFRDDWGYGDFHSLSASPVDTRYNLSKLHT